MEKLFGTDGIRGKANLHPMTAETALAVGKAVVRHFGRGPGRPRVVIGKDTRESGDMLAHALAAGVCAMGADVWLAGVVPTPAVAYATRGSGACAGVVISASHNPYTDNGIKLFQGDGFKPSVRVEAEIEALVRDPGLVPPPSGDAVTIGRVLDGSGAAADYKAFLLGIPSEASAFQGITLVLDCANGATHAIAPEVFRALGARVIPLFTEPDGRNINHQCGSEHPEALARAVTANRADLGLAFDGDGDRLIPVDESGRVLTGDQFLGICAAHLLSTGRLENPRVVSTVMSNLGLGIALKDMGIAHDRVPVGDRHVVERMREIGAVIGGEDSGHMVFFHHHTTGDGIVAGIQLLEVMAHTGRPLSQLSRVVTVLPQRMENVNVKHKPNIEKIPEILEIIHKIENQLKGKGRVLVRYSGTQPMCRVMVEGPTESITEQYCRQIAEVVRKSLG